MYQICRAFEKWNKHVQEIRDTHEILSIKSIEKMNIQMKETRNGNKFWKPDLEQIMKGEDFY